MQWIFDMYNISHGTVAAKSKFAARSRTGSGLALGWTNGRRENGA